MVYLDNAATTRPDEAVCVAMDVINETCFGNPSSLHMAGVRAEQAVSVAREQLAAALGAKENEIYFGPGGTLCNNVAVIGGALARKRRGDKVVISAIEHACVREAAMSLKEQGFTVVEAEPTVEGFAAQMDGKTVLISCMLVNNETGLRLPVEQLAALKKRVCPEALFHIDAVQALGKVPLSVQKLGCDALTVSSHKIHGPKGCGALYLKSGVRISPLYFGGGQEKDLFPGTHNTAAIVGFGKAASFCVSEFALRQERLKALCDYFLTQAEKREYLALNREGGAYAPHIVNVSFLGYVGENVLHALEAEEVYVSVGAACSNNSGHGSILDKLHAEPKRVKGAIRVSFSHHNTLTDVDAFFAAADKAAGSLIRKY